MVYGSNSSTQQYILENKITNFYRWNHVCLEILTVDFHQQIRLFILSINEIIMWSKKLKVGSGFVFLNSSFVKEENTSKKEDCPKTIS